MKYLWTILFFALVIGACGEDDTPCPDCGKHNWKLDETPYEYGNIPAHIGNIKALIPASNPLTVSKVALGKKLFYDPLLSRDYTVSCSSCHHPDKAFSDPRPISLGVEDRPGTRNAPALMNLMFGKSFFWDGNTPTLEDQALIPIDADFEMDNTVEEVLRRINSDTVYQRMFWEAFGKEPDADGLAKALSSFERILVSFDTRFDEYIVTRNPNLFTASETRGLQLFNSEQADCFHCHVTPQVFTDESFRDNGLEFLNNDIGREAVTGDPADRLRFKVSTLRNLAFTAPYMHDGRFNTLEEVIDHYISGGANRNTQSPFVPPEAGSNLLTAQQKEDLKNFLLTITDSSFNNNPEYMP